VADTAGPEQVEDVSGADRARADAEWGGTPAALGTSGATWHDLAGDQQTRRGAAPARPRAAAMALLRRGDLSVTEVCFAVGYSSLGTFSSRFIDLVGMPPSTYRRHAARATAGMPSCVAKQVTRPIRNREAPVTEPHLE